MADCSGLFLRTQALPSGGGAYMCTTSLLQTRCQYIILRAHFGFMHSFVIVIWLGAVQCSSAASSIHKRMTKYTVHFTIVAFIDCRGQSVLQAKRIRHEKRAQKR